jgi:hypothetical protein
MPSVKTITNPKLSTTLNLFDCEIGSDGTAYTHLEFDLSELTEGMELNLSQVNFPENPIKSSLPYVSKVTHSGNQFTYHSATTPVYSSKDYVLINLPTGVYLPKDMGYIYDYHTKADDIVRFIMQSSVFNFSLMSDDFKPTVSNSSEVPAIEIVREISDNLYDAITNNGTNGLSLTSYSDGNTAGLYYNLPYLAYISGLTGNGSTFTVTDGVNEGTDHLKITGIINDRFKYIPRLRKYYL